MFPSSTCRIEGCWWPNPQSNWSPCLSARICVHLASTPNMTATTPIIGWQPNPHSWCSPCPPTQTCAHLVSHMTATMTFADWWPNPQSTAPNIHLLRPNPQSTAPHVHTLSPMYVSLQHLKMTATTPFMGRQPNPSPTSAYSNTASAPCLWCPKCLPSLLHPTLP